MKCNDSLLVALLAVLIIIVVFQSSCWMKMRGDMHQRHHNSSCDGFASGLAHQHEGDNPYTALHNKLELIRGSRHDGYGQKPVWDQPHGLDRYIRSGAHLRPEDIAEAEREQWFAATEASHSEGFNTELSQDMQTDTMQYHTTQPSIDYSGLITDLVVDPRTRENHQRWAEEMKPWSGTAMMVDNMDEAMEAGADFIGLRRPQAIVQHNPLQLTERDTYTYATNPKFNFKG